MTHKNVSVVVEIPENVNAYLLVLARENLAGAKTVSELLAWFASCAADGMRRPGAWERGWLTQCVGSSWQHQLEQVPEVPYPQLQPKGVL